MTASTETERVAARHTPAPLTVEIPLDQIDPSPTNPRRRFAEDTLQELADSIRDHGLIEPLVVRPAGERFTIVAGERRFRACRLAGLTRAPSRVIEVDDAEALRIQLIENLQRQDLDPIEEACGYQQLHDVLGLTQTAIAAAVNRSHSAVAHALRLLELPEVVQDHLREGRLSVAHGKALVQFAPWPKLCTTIATHAVDEGFTSKAIQKGVGSGGLSGYVLAGEGALTRVDLPEGCTVDDLTAAGVTVWGSGSYYDTFTPDKAAYERARDAIAKERQAEQQRQMQTLRDEAKATGKAVIKLAKLSYGDYEDLSYGARPAGCGPDCPCLAQALARKGSEIVPICTDPARFKRLKKADQSADSKQRKEQVRQKADELDAILTATPALDARGLAVVVADRLCQFPKAVSKRLVSEFAGDVLDPSVFDSYDGRRDTYPKLATLPAETLIRMLVHGKLLDEINRYQQYGTLSKELTWYMEGAGVAMLPTDPAELKRRIAEARAAIGDIKVQNQPGVCARWQATLQQLEATLAVAQKPKPVRTNPTVCRGCGHVKGKCTCPPEDTADHLAALETSTAAIAAEIQEAV